MSYEEEYEDDDSLEVYDDSEEEIDVSDIENDAKDTSEVGFELGYEMDEDESMRGKEGTETLTKYEEKKEEVDDYSTGEGDEEEF